MSVLLFLLNLPFLLLFLLVLCGRKKKKSNEGTLRTPVKTSIASKTSNEPPKEASPSASTSNSKAANKSKTSTGDNGNSNSNVEKPIEPKEIKEEETQDNSEEREIKLANVILSIHKEFRPENIITGRMRKQASDREYCITNWTRGIYRKRIESDFSLANEAYSTHKCTHPEKNKIEDEKCDVCKHYFDFIAKLYEHHYFYSIDIKTSTKIAEDLYDYGGKLPSFMENLEWLKAKEQLKKDMGEEKKFDPPVGTPEERDRQIEEEAKKLRQIIDHVDYWTSPDDEFKQRIAKDFEETRQIYRKHDCRGIPPDKGYMCYYCYVCKYYFDEKWTERLYKDVMKNEKRFPDGMKRQLEEDFFLHLKKFEAGLPKFIENWRWTRAKEWIARKREKSEMDKMLEKTQNEEMPLKEEKKIRQK